MKSKTVPKKLQTCLFTMFHICKKVVIEFHSTGMSLSFSFNVMIIHDMLFSFFMLL